MFKKGSERRILSKLVWILNFVLEVFKFQALQIYPKLPSEKHNICSFLPTGEAVPGWPFLLFYLLRNSNKSLEKKYHSFSLMGSDREQQCASTTSL